MKRSMIGMLLVLAVFLPVDEVQARKVRLKLGHVLSARHPVHTAMVFLATRVQELTDGQVEITIKEGGQYPGGETGHLEMVQQGTLDITKVASSVVENFVSQYKAYSMPYLFRDEAHMWAVLEGSIGQEILAAGQAKGLIGLCYLDAGFRSFYTTKGPIRTPDDLQGMKLRTQTSQMMVDMVSMLGASATPIDWGELYTALSSGTVDGAENNVPSLYEGRHYEICKYYCLDRHVGVPDVLLMSEKAWNRLDAKQQEALKQALNETVAFQRKLWKEKCDEYLTAMEQAGLRVNEVDLTAFQQRVQPLWDKVAQEDPETAALAEKMRQVK